MIDFSQLKTEAETFGVALDDEMMAMLDRYACLLVEWNEKMNLTAITQPPEIVTKHFVDSMSLLKAFDFKEGTKVIDVGTGAGFPGVVLKIVRPDLEVTLLDSQQKRLRFLEELCGALAQENRFIHARAEDAGRMQEYREKFDFATARAVSNLQELCEYCLPYVKVGGFFAAMKGEVKQELKDAMNAIRVLGGKLEEVKELRLADGSQRSIVLIKKISHSSPKYPRPHAKMAKFPLK